jgi:hypothetical protein
MTEIKMTTLTQLRKIAPEGAVISDRREGQTHSCDVDAPPLKVWVASGNHSLVDAAYIPWRPDYADLIERVEMGVQPCVDPACEWCADTLAELEGEPT